MTAHQEVRYHCDRCLDDAIMTLATGVPAHARMSGPPNWLMIRIGDDPSTPPSHLCPKCNSDFTNFMGVSHERQGSGD